MLRRSGRLGLAATYIDRGVLPMESGYAESLQRLGDVLDDFRESA